jgi:hypothetical protein
MKIIRFFLLIFFIEITCSFPAFAANTMPIVCKDFKGLSLEVKKQIISLNDKFDWNNPNCKIVATKSIFPKKDKFEKGMQLFIYQDYQLKFICLPGWACKSW